MDDTETTAIPILFQDEDLVAVVKPAGMMVHRSWGAARDELFLLQAVSCQIGRYVYPVQRLDRNTSGVMVFALSSEMAREIQATISTDAVVKEYLTLCRGTTDEAFIVERPLTASSGAKQASRSDFRRLATFSRCSLLAVRLHTGRKHQIRRHLSHLAHQIIGDSSYGKGRINAFFRETYGLPRMALHARRLSLPHPRTGERLDFNEPLADDLRAFLLRLPDVDRAVVESI
ncbi:MAG: pseudouridine synthase [Planctomycetota bacterium]